MEKDANFPINSSCPRCGKAFTCGAKAGSTTCWCAQLPNVISLEGLQENGQTYQGCLCPDCLQEIIRTRQHPSRH